MRLGELLIERGLVTHDELRSALDACRRHGGRLGTWLVRLGTLNEAELLQALSEQTGAPSATALELASASPELRALLPASFARRHLAVVFGRRGRTLDVAMSDPNDLIARDEISSMTGMVVRPHVATEAALSAALAIPVSSASTPPAAPPPGPPRGTVREWNQFWRLESHPREIFSALDGELGEPPVRTVAGFPDLVPHGEADVGVDAIDLDHLADTLSAVTHRDQVAELALSFASLLAPRAALFSLHQGRVLGWAVRSPWVVQEDFHTLILPLDRPSVFLNLTKGVDLHSGPLGGGEGNDLLLEALGTPKPEAALIAPIRVRSRTVAFLWLDAGGASVGELPVAAVREAARLVGMALEVLVLRQKLKGGGRLTEGAGEG